MLLPETIEQLIARMTAAGHSCHAVGGCVRDALRGAVPGDYDLTTSALPEETMAVFAGQSDIHSAVIPTGLKHGTVTVVCGKMPVEITTYRLDGSYSDGRRPDEVTFTPSLEEDLARRDFTVNAMAWGGRDNPELTDPFGGRADLDAGIIRCVGDPVRRFSEDALRILRAVRFASQLDFVLAPATARAMLDCREKLRLVSAERIQTELVKLLCGQAAGRILADYGEILQVFLPEWSGDVPDFSVLAPDGPTRLALFLCRCSGDPEALLRRLKCGGGRFADTLALCRAMARPFSADSALLRRRASELGWDLTRRLAHLHRAEGHLDEGGLFACLARLDDLEAGCACISLSALALSGQDLLDAGFPPGKSIGILRRALFDGVLDGRLINEKKALLTEARRLSALSGGKE